MGFHYTSRPPPSHERKSRRQERADDDKKEIIGNREKKIAGNFMVAAKEIFEYLCVVGRQDEL